MIARVTRWEFDSTPEQVEKVIRRNRDEVLPAAHELPGFGGFFSLVDRESGRALTLTLWTDEDAERASEAAANRLRAKTRETTGIAMIAAERYEVAVQWNGV
jgi:heme-degrading monooxygenase HmoA